MTDPQPLPRRSGSLSATLKGFQTMFDDGLWDATALADAVMHLDIDMEGEAGEILELREKLLVAEWDRSVLQTERDAAILAATMELRALVRRAFGLVGYACDVPQRELEAQQWLEDAAKIVTEDPADAF